MTASPQYNYQNYGYPNAISPNAVNINIISPTAYGSNTQGAVNPVSQNGYSLYGTSPNNGMYYPSNYNNMFSSVPACQTAAQPVQNPIMQQNPANQAQMYDYAHGANNNGQDNQKSSSNALDGANMANNAGLLDKTPQNEQNVSQNEKVEDKAGKKEDEKKQIVPLTDDYIKSLENYLNDSNPKVRLIAAKDIMERFKEDENRKDNKSLIPLLNKMLRDTSPSVKFLGLTTLDLGYCVGDNETVQILKDMQKNSDDKTGQNQLLASQILLKMTSPDKVDKEA